MILVSDSSHGVEPADLKTLAALDAPGRIDHVRLLLLAADAVGRALLGAEHAAGAGLGVDVVRDQRLALAGRAALLVDMRFVFIAEVPDGREHRVGRRAAEGAERALEDVVGELLEQLDVALAALAADDAVEEAGRQPSKKGSGRPNPPWLPWPSPDRFPILSTRCIGGPLT